MENTKEQLTLIERWNKTGEAPIYFQKRHPGKTYYPERVDMEREIAHLIESELGTESYWREPNPELLAEYRKHFDWDTSYGVKVRWDIYIPTGSSHIACESLEEALEYLNEDKTVEEPGDWEEVADDDPYVEGEEGRFASISISNLRLKQQKHRYSVVLVVESDTPVEDNAIPSVLSALSQGQSWEIVSSTQAAAEKGM